MDHFTLSLCVGAAAGALDVIPMIAQRLAFRSCLSAFCTYLFAAVIVFHGRLPYLPWWADGMAVALMAELPDRRLQGSYPGDAALNALLLGFLISVAERYLAA